MKLALAFFLLVCGAATDGFKKYPQCQPYFSFNDSCTRISCDQHGQFDSSTKFSERKLCNSGDSWIVGGRFCHCLLPITVCNERYSDSKGVWCQPGFEFDNGCNRIFCNKKGRLDESSVFSSAPRCVEGAKWTIDGLRFVCEQGLVSNH